MKPALHYLYFSIHVHRWNEFNLVNLEYFNNTLRLQMHNLCSEGTFCSPEMVIQAPQSFSGGSVVKNLPANAGGMGWIPGLVRFPGEGNGNPLQYSCLGAPIDRESGGLQSMGSQRVGHNLATKQQQSFRVSICT